MQGVIGPPRSNITTENDVAKKGEMIEDAISGMREGDNDCLA